MHWPSSAATYGMHDFDAITVANAVVGMGAARDDLPVDLDCDAFVAVSGCVKQLAKRLLVVECSGFAVENDVHA